MPAVLSRLASARGETLNIQRALNSGYTLQQTWDAGTPQPFLTVPGQWDFVVLQEYSTLPVQDPNAFYRTALSTYEPAVRPALKPNVGRLVLFENWALADPYPFSTRAEYVAALDRNYDSLSHQLSTPNLIAPQSKAFEKVFASQPLTYLLDPDGKHPNDAGIYLNACIFHAILFHESPIGLPPLYLPAAQAAFLQDVANQVVGSATVDAGPLADAGAAADAGASGGGTTSGVLFVDNFNRTLASGLGPRWSIQIGAWRTNDKANSDLDAPNQASVAGLSCRDCSVQARVVNFAATTAALDLRHGSSNARYDLALLGSGHIQIRRHDGSTFTVLGDAADAGPPGGGTTSRVLFVDNFNRTLASDLGPIWSVQVGAWRTNDKANSDLDAPNQASVTGLSCRDCSVQARVLNFAATTAALDLRHGSSNARYDLALLSTGRIQIRRHNGGAFTVLGDVASGIVDLGNWATLALSATGAGPVQLTASVNGATKLKVTDTSAAAITGAGTAGIWTDLAGVWFDDFTVIGVGP